MSILPVSRLAIPLALAASLAAAQPPAPKAPAPPPPPPAPTAPRVPEYNTNREFQSRLLVVQHRSPSALRSALQPLGSGFKGAELDYTDRDGVRALSVRDFPENVAAIEAALKRLDLPASSRKEVELYIHVFFASAQEAPAESVPEEMKEVLASLKSTLNYRSYTPVGSFLQRVSEGMDMVNGNGMRDLVFKGPEGKPVTASVNFNWSVRPIRYQEGSDGRGSFFLESFRFLIQENSGRSARVETPLTMKDGEKVVVGTSTYRDQGVIVVVAAKVVK